MLHWQRTSHTAAEEAEELADQPYASATSPDRGAASGQGWTTWLGSATKGMHLGPKGTGDAPGAATIQLAGVAHVHTSAVEWRLKHTNVRVETELRYS